MKNDVGSTIYSLHQKGMSNSAIAKSLHTHRNNVRYWLIKQGLHSNFSRGVQPIIALLSDNERFCHHKQRSIRNKCKYYHQTYDLPEGYIYYLFERQEGKCFYTDIPLTLLIGEGHSPNSLSLDRVLPSGHYTKENIVLSSRRVNSIKNNITLKEMREWMPNWFNRLVKEEQTGRINLHLGE